MQCSSFLVTLQVVGVDCCPSLELFVTVSDDGTVKVRFKRGQVLSVSRN